MRSRHSAGRGLAVVFMAFATGCKSNKIFRIIRAFPPVFHGAADFSHVPSAETRQDGKRKGDARGDMAARRVTGSEKQRRQPSRGARTRKSVGFPIAAGRGMPRNSVSSSKLLRGRNLRAYLVPKLRWQEIYARILLQIFAGKKFTRVSCPNTSLARNLRAYLAQNFAGKVSQRDSCPKSSLGRYRGAILVPNLRWEGIVARFLLQIFAGKVSRRDSCRLAAATCLPPL